MTVTEILTQLQMEKTGDLEKDLKHLRDAAYDLRKEPNADELVKAIAEYAYSIMPEQTRKEMEQLTYVDGMRMDEAFSRALKLVDSGDTAAAEPLLKAISDKIAEHYEHGDTKYFSFRNPFEYHMYRYFYPDDTVFERAPFDFAHYLEVYGFTLLNNRKAREAVKVLERAIKFNPVSADMRFEIAEAYKFMHARARLLEACQDTLPLCTSPDRIARVLANMGYYCYEVGDLYEAAVFYFESIRFSPRKTVELELQDTVRRMKVEGKKFAPPTHGQTIDVYEKYSMKQPPNSELVNLAVTMAHEAQKYQRPDLEGLFTRVAFDLTNDPEFAKRLAELDGMPVNA